MNKEIVDLVNGYFIEDGIQKTNIKGISLFKSSISLPRSPLIYDLCLVIVIQGEKTGYLGENIFHYNQENYLVIPTTLPFECETIVTKDKPFLAIFHKINKNLMYEVIDMIGNKAIQECKQCNLGIFSDKITPKIEDIIRRMLETISSKEESIILGESLIKELYYRIAISQNAHFLHKMFLNNKIEAKITRTLKTIHRNFNEHFDIPRLAREEDMSVSSFNSHFKKITSMTPLQYIKKIRLQKAMDLLTKENAQVNDTAFAIGYESSSQFSKDFKSYYGFPPKDAKPLVPQILNKF